MRKGSGENVPGDVRHLLFLLANGSCVLRGCVSSFRIDALNVVATKLLRLWASLLATSGSFWQRWYLLIAEVEPRPALVRSSPESGHSPTRQPRPLWVRTGSRSPPCSTSAVPLKADVEIAAPDACYGPIVLQKSKTEQRRKSRKS